MPIAFQRKDFLEDCQSIADILFEEPYGRIQTHLAKVFGLDLKDLYSLGRENGCSVLQELLKKEYDASAAVVQERILTAEQLWKQADADVFAVLRQIFGPNAIESTPIHAWLSINGVCPRYLDRLSFDVNFRKRDAEILQTCIHEIIHFVWFEKWLNLFPGTERELFDAPHAPWLLSEIAIDAVFQETDLRKFCLSDRPAYQYFYDIELDGQNMMAYFRELFVSCTISEFMEKGLEYVMRHKEQLG